MHKTLQRYPMRKARLGGIAIACAAIAAVAVDVASAQSQGDNKQPPGLQVVYQGLKGDDPAAFHATAPNIRLYAEEGTPPTPFLPAGRFKVKWSGTIWTPMRSEYTFTAENLKGEFTLRINGKTVMKASEGSSSSEPIRLDKGENAISAELVSPQQGDTSVRLLWDNRDLVKGPIPNDQLRRPELSGPFRQDARQRHGRDLFLKFRCANCHISSELEADARRPKNGPDLTGIGSRRRQAWMKEWILNPRATRHRATMPQLFTGKDAAKKAEAIAAFLKAQESPQSTGRKPTTAAQGDPTTGKKLFNSLHCAACHQAPQSEKTPQPDQIGLDHVRQKFSAGGLAAFLQAPEQHYRWIRMPNFDLSDSEATDLAAYLKAEAKPVETQSKGGDPSESKLARGKALVQESGCLNCHQLDLPNTFSAPALNALNPSSWDQGCLASSPDPDIKAPFFGLSGEEQSALQAFAKTDRLSLSRNVPSEFARRATAELNCKNCHGEIEEAPNWEGLGGKLKPEWMQKLFAGKIDYKPRPWIEARMPRFPSRAEGLAHGLANRHGLPSETPEPPPIDEELAKTGRQLVGTQSGLACVNCHGIGSMEPLQVFEGQGVNLAHTAERLHKSYFVRWMLNPLQVDPQSRMPAFFYDGQSPLFNVLGGDAQKQIDAIWQYLRRGDQMKPPEQ